MLVCSLPGGLRAECTALMALCVCVPDLMTTVATCVRVQRWYGQTERGRRKRRRRRKLSYKRDYPWQRRERTILAYFSPGVWIALAAL